jgi:hypothetical protein
MQPFPLPEQHRLSREESGKRRLGAEELRKFAVKLEDYLPGKPTEVYHRSYG